MTRLRDWTGVDAGLLTNERIADLETDFARYLYVCLLLSADSYGCMEASPRVVLAKAAPLLNRTADDVAKALADLDKVRLVSPPPAQRPSVD